jgi:hypothetical protein
VDAYLMENVLANVIIIIIYGFLNTITVFVNVCNVLIHAINAKIKRLALVVFKVFYFKESA